jgi:hypothetical protein
MNSEQIRWNHFKRPSGIISALVLLYGAASMLFGVTFAEGGLAYGWNARIIGFLFLLAGGWLFTFSYWVVLRRRDMKVASKILATLFFVAMVTYLYANLRA